MRIFVEIAWYALSFFSIPMLYIGIGGYWLVDLRNRLEPYRGKNPVDGL